MAKTKFNQRLADAICDRIAKGESLRSICKGESMPSEAAVRLWAIDDREGFAAQYERAREMQADGFVDDIVNIADTEPDPNVARVRIDARKWVAGKQRPKKYGEKITQELSGPNGGPIEQQVTRIERVIVDAPANPDRTSIPAAPTPGSL